MSYRAVFFAVPTEEATEAELIARLPRATFTPKTWSTIEKYPPIYSSPERVPEGSQTHAYAALATEELAQASGLRYFFLATNDRGWDYWSKFELPSFFEQLAPWTVITLSHDDRHGVFFFERRASTTPKLTWILTAGALYGGTMSKITVRFKQKAYTVAQLEKILQKDEADMTPAERRAATEPDDAITIGLRQLYPRARYGEYLDLLHASHFWRYNSKDKPVVVPRPGRPAALVGRIPSNSHIRRAGLTGEARELPA